MDLADHVMERTRTIFKHMPKSVVQELVLREELDPGTERVKAYLDLEKHGFDQIPTGSYHDYNTGSIGSTVAFGKNI